MSTATHSPIPAHAQAGGPTGTVAETAARRIGPGQLASTGSYNSLSKAIREAGLLGRTRGFYISLISILGVLLVGLGTGSFLLGDSWFQLILAGALGILLTQAAFIAHEASHRQVFTSGKANDRLGRILANGVVGISHAWWMSKHSKHHANPNQIGKDPDIEMDTLSFVEESARTRTGFFAALTRVQGYAFFPLLLLEGLNLHVTSLRSLFTAPKGTNRAFELSILLTRLSIYVALILWFLPLGMGFAFLGVQLAVFGLYMGASFAPNHKGMPIIPEGSRLDFLSKQVLTSRNITGGWSMKMAMGGLNYQIEHHLFPSMPRPHLAKARLLVKDHCIENSVPYTETTLMKSYGIVVRYLNRVGLAARDPFDCPMVRQFRGR